MLQNLVHKYCRHARHKRFPEPLHRFKRFGINLVRHRGGANQLGIILLADFGDFCAIEMADVICKVCKDGVSRGNRISEVGDKLRLNALRRSMCVRWFQPKFRE